MLQLRLLLQLFLLIQITTSVIQLKRHRYHHHHHHHTNRHTTSSESEPVLLENKHKQHQKDQDTPTSAPTASSASSGPTIFPVIQLTSDADLADAKTALEQRVSRLEALKLLRQLEFGSSSIIPGPPTLQTYQNRKTMQRYYNAEDRVRAMEKDAADLEMRLIGKNLLQPTTTPGGSGSNSNNADNGDGANGNGDGDSQNPFGDAEDISGMYGNGMGGGGGMGDGVHLHLHDDRVFSAVSVHPGPVHVVPALPSCHCVVCACHAMLEAANQKKPAVVESGNSNGKGIRKGLSSSSLLQRGSTGQELDTTWVTDFSNR